jgi:hypothetical protein
MIYPEPYVCDAASDDGLKGRNMQVYYVKSATSHLKENIRTIGYTVWRIKMQNIKKNLIN